MFWLSNRPSTQGKDGLDDEPPPNLSVQASSTVGQKAGQEIYMEADLIEWLARHALPCSKLINSHHKECFRDVHLQLREVRMMNK